MTWNLYQKENFLKPLCFSNGKTQEGVVKEVYEIFDWVPAGSQEYFSRELSQERLEKANWEFIGKKASNEIRERYKGRVLNRNRSYGDPFIKVGYDIE